MTLRGGSWVQTSAKIRKLGGALFCDRRDDTVARLSQRCRVMMHHAWPGNMSGQSR
jgi:hypothetical protein